MRILPINPKNKRPRVGGFDDVEFTVASRDFGKRDAIGILCGPCPAGTHRKAWLLCIDLDGGLTRRKLERALGVRLPDTLATHDEAHLWFWVSAAHAPALKQWNGILGARKTWKGEGKAPDADVKWAGGYAVERGEPTDFDVEAIATLPLDAIRAIATAPGVPKNDPNDEGDGLDLPECAPVDAARADALIDALADEWPAAGGGRHDAALALGGALRRAGVDQDDAQAIAEAVVQATQSDPARVRDALDAWERADSGGRAYGASTLATILADGGPKTREALASIARPPAWVAQWVATLEAARGEPLAGPPSADTHATEDATGGRLCARTGWPWVLQKENIFWLHSTTEPAYGAEVPSVELEATARARLHGLVDPADGWKLAELKAGGWISAGVRLRPSYAARANTYDPATHTLETVVLRWMTPERACFHAHIDRWLRALWGEHYDRGAQWLASCVALDRPAPCMYLAGERNVGKTLLGVGLAKLWGAAEPCAMAQTIADHNEAQWDCPLVVADEGFPVGMSFDLFRSMVTAHSRLVNRKYRPKVPVAGCGRYMIGANNDDVLRWMRMGTLTQADVDAIVERMLVLPCRSEARTELERWEPSQAHAAADSAIAEHVLWLAEVTALEARGRMCVAPYGGEPLMKRVLSNRHEAALRMVETGIRAGAAGERIGVTVKGVNVRVSVARLRDALEGSGWRGTGADVREFCDAYRAQRRAEVKVNGYRLRQLDLARVTQAIRALS